LPAIQAGKVILGRHFIFCYLDVTLNGKSFPRYMKTIEEETQRAWRKYRMARMENEILL
jgi:hypothetical protein